MRTPHPVRALALAALLAAAPAAAEPLGSHFEITPYGGFTIFDTKLKAATGSPVRDAVYLGGRFGWHPKSWWGLEVAAGITPTAEDLVSGAQDINFVHGSGNIVLTPIGKRAGGPFISVGYGGSRLTPKGGADFNQANIELAAGARLWLTDAVGIRIEARDLHWTPKYSYQQSTDNIILGGGLTVALGATPRDTDGDGVPDKVDKCPDTPHGARVDTEGCPIDSDGDKVFDGLDQCPSTPAGCTVDLKGCPSDADSDGVCDGRDQCPDTPKGATVDAKGCPTDSDGDGVLDGLDKCANTPKGCTVDSTGCPRDADGDGVCDGLDKCPDTSPGLKVDANGCPIELIERETELLDTGMIRLHDINFETGKAVVPPDAYEDLNVVGQVLDKWPELRIEVGGHTDSRGSDKANQKLSEDRAGAVLTYLKSKYPTLKPEQYTVKGYGESKPLVPNTSQLNMSKNRRVEFVVLNKDVLRREIERRRLLKVNEGAAPDSTKK